MTKSIVSSDDVWRIFQVLGSSFSIQSGIASTIQEANGKPIGYFSGESTVILGSGEATIRQVDTETQASWRIAIEPFWLQNFMRGFLVFGCLRYFGGVHSCLYGAQVEIFFNDKCIDKFGLKVIPPNHSDYFHRIEIPKLPDLWPLSGCQTTYAWPIQKIGFTSDLFQTVRGKIDKEVSWDIDYVAIVCKAEKLQQRLFLCHATEDKEDVRKLAKELTDRGIGVWLDEAEIKLGDSLLDKICEGINTVEYFIVFLSKASVNSPWVKLEVRIAMDEEIEGKRVKILPIILEHCDLPKFLKGKYYADLTDKNNHEKVIRQIEERLQV